MKDLIKRIKENKNTIYIMSGILCIFLILLIILIVTVSVKSKKISNLNKEIINLQEQEANRLKNSDEYNEFESIILAFAQEMYYQAYNYYSKDYFISDEMKDINDKLYWKMYRIDELKSIFTDKKFEDFIKTEKILKQGEEYYIPVMPKQENDLYIKEYSGEMAIREINDDRIEIAVKEVYYKGEDDLLDLNNLENKINAFILIKEHGIWRIDDFTYPN